MEMPSILQGESLTRLLQGAAAGAVATLVVGFYWGGWVTGGSAKEMSQRNAALAVVNALAPICVDKFLKSSEVAANTIELKKASTWQQGSFITKGGWATTPGESASNSAVADACANLLLNPKT
jgi:hypothetical protein